MLIKKNQTHIESFGKGTVWDYPMPNEELGISYQEHNGRVPEKGWGINTICHEAYYVIEGRAKVFVNESEYEVQKGDVVILEPGQKSYLVADSLKLLTITRPNWSEKQYHEID